MYLLLRKIGIVRWVYHFAEHHAPTKPLTISNPEEMPLEPESKFFLKGTPLNYKAMLLQLIKMLDPGQQALDCISVVARHENKCA